MKQREIKNFIKSIIREVLSDRTYQELLTEVSPPGAKAERMIQHVKKSLRDTHPDWGEDKITSVAIATAWKARNKGNIESEQVGADVVADEKTHNEDEHEYGYNEKDEIDLIHQLHDVVAKLLKMHNETMQVSEGNMIKNTPRRKILARKFKKGLEEISRICEFHLDEASYKQVSKNETDTSEEDKARTIQTNPKVTENHKVQYRSAKTVNDLDNDPQNVRDPEVPQA